MNKSVTLKSIAAHLNVSVSTVAKSLKNGEGIGAETVALVRATADELGYVRNLDGVKLRTGNSFVLMAHLGMPSSDDVGDAGAIGLLQGIHRRLQHTDYSVRAAPVFYGDKAIDQLKRVVSGRAADGFILDQIKCDDERVDFLLDSNIPFVTFGRDNRCSEHPYFDLDNERAAYDTTCAMIDAGCRRISLLEGDPTFQYVVQRRAGYRKALSDHGIDFNADLVVQIDLDAPSAYAATQALIKDHGADAVNCLNQPTLLGAHNATQAHGQTGNRSVRLASVTSSNIGQYLGIDLHASHYPRVDAGWCLADALLANLDGKPTHLTQRTEPMTLMTYKRGQVV
ncbi:LacI family transcriptional regulator [Rhodophyticola sp. CCM32]|uniref:LacI family DNA-binding transcriptional regulator n=1 Tax=Rhodophyticola sp. CCM32 TaxID=2916397 RepID=UPI00107F285B|nr:LacI family DNA-binding transcriptional regulator [Rhodophyticola sp. CCM32]QBY01220.1 LacI family transcriptional regulator [Rhodophyticola sp. CCM32]